MMERIRRRIFDIIQIGQVGDWISRLFDIVIVITIFLNISVLFLETFSQLSKYYNCFKGIEIITIIFFCVEYILRIWTADYLYQDVSRGKAILKFLVSFDGLVDLLTILPFFFLSGFVALRMLRVVRIFHLFRINAYYDSINVITSVLKDKKNQILSSIVILFILMMMSSLSMYSAEKNAQPEVFKNAFSGIWWSISTILTVGYGDIYPITVLGKAMAIVIALLGVGAVAIPTGIISAGFVEQYTVMQNSKDVTVPATVRAIVEKNSPFAGMKVKEFEKNYNAQLLLIIRKGEVVLTTDKHKICVGDNIVYQTMDLYNKG